MKSLTQKIIIVVALGLLTTLWFVFGSMYPAQAASVGEPMFEFFVYAFLASLLALLLRPNFYAVWRWGLLIFGIFSVASIAHAPVRCSSGFMLSLFCSKQEIAGINGLLCIAVTGGMVLISIFSFLVNYIRKSN